MPGSILVTYATRSGSTGEVAQAIGDALHAAGFAADVLPMRQVESLAGKTAVILGAPLYLGRFPRDFHRFLSLHRDALVLLRPCCFVLGPTRTQPADFDAARKQAEAELVRYPWFHPACLQVFGGKLDMDRLPFPFSLARRLPSFILKEIPAADIRDWTAIRQWASGIARQLKPAA